MGQKKTDKTKKGKVYLVGAGPGDPTLITVKGVRFLGKADVVIYDYLANKKLLEHAPKEAELIYVGKRGDGQHAQPQDAINTLLVEKAKEGKNVVRLKGGDPFIFGRGGEELEELVEAGIPFEVVPGVTAATGAATYAGVPITHREMTSTVAFVTGHEDPTKEATSIDWSKIATGVGTLVFYMGIKNLPSIVERLMENGRDPQTPVVVVRWASTPEQRSVEGTLATISEVVQREGIRPPALVVVGEVVKLREKINWYEKRPLFGKRIVVTRTQEQASDLLAGLEELGADCIEYSTISILPPDSWEQLDGVIPSLGSYQWILFTSTNAIKCFFNHLEEKGLDARALGGTRVGVVGTATADLLKTFGVRADLIPKKFTGDGLADELLALGVQGSKILVPRALKARESLPERLREGGAEVTVVPVYQNVRPQGEKEKLHEILARRKPHAITFTSSSTVTNFLHMLDAADNEELKTLLKGIVIASIGPITSKTATDAGLSVSIQPDMFTIPALIESISHFFVTESA